MHQSLVPGFPTGYGVAMETAANGWKIFDADAPVLTYSYSFGPGMANALAVGAESGIIVISPPCRVETSVFDGLSRYGRVVALIASNAFHHMGIPEWKRRFPDAAVYAPAQSIARVERKTKLSGIRPIAEASSITGSRLELIDMPHYRTGEVLACIKTGRGLAWYVTDCILNMPELPAHPIARMLFKLTGSAPGLKFSNLGALFMVKDKAALKRWLASEFDKAAPRWLIATHGDIVEVGPNIEAVRKLFK